MNLDNPDLHTTATLIFWWMVIDLAVSYLRHAARHRTVWLPRLELYVGQLCLMFLSLAITNVTGPWGPDYVTAGLATSGLIATLAMEWPWGEARRKKR